jgi:hypothetical protein
VKTDAGDGRQERHAMVDVRSLPVGEDREELQVTLDDLALALGG